MNAFSAAMDRIFGHSDMATSAVWFAGGTSEERPIRLIRRGPDRIAPPGVLSSIRIGGVVLVAAADGAEGAAAGVGGRARRSGSWVTKSLISNLILI